MALNRPTHEPVMLDRVVALFTPALADGDRILVDATLGLGGHSQALLTAFPNLRVVGLDRDQAALSTSRRRLREFGDRLLFVHAIYDELPRVLRDHQIDGIDGVLFDLGVSSMQLDDLERGFSYAHDSPLDMRMDQTAELTAADIVNGYDASQLASILRRYGEERFAQRIAHAIVKHRDQEPLTHSSQLVDIVREAIPAAARRTGGNPAKRTFQALRIEVNDELGAVERAIPAAIEALRLHGRIVALAYQSLEDRIVKQTLVGSATDPTPAKVPLLASQRRSTLRLLTRGAERPSDDEVAANPRAKSARLRAAERVGEAA